MTEFILHGHCSKPLTRHAFELRRVATIFHLETSPRFIEYKLSTHNGGTLYNSADKTFRNFERNELRCFTVTPRPSDMSTTGDDGQPGLVVELNCVTLRQPF